MREFDFMMTFTFGTIFWISLDDKAVHFNWSRPIISIYSGCSATIVAQAHVVKI